jgi:hypothetical protein
VGVPFTLNLPGVSKIIDSSRNFYGLSSIKQFTSGGDYYTAIVSGNILHGTQHAEESIEPMPTAYYALGSGVEHAFVQARSKRDGLRVLVIGLGAGTIAAYCEPNDHFTFIEINPAVIAQAQKYFSFLHACETEIITGDGRITLQQKIDENSATYDLIFLDAFTDDAIPATLLTREAFTMYRQALTDAGVLAIHITNSYLDLVPVVAAGLAHIDYRGALVSGFPKARSAQRSEWIIAHKGIVEFPDMIPQDGMTVRDVTTASKIHAWTDDRSSVLPNMKWW